MSSELTLSPVSYDHPAVVELTALVQEFYVRVYGGTDDSPIDAGEFVAPHGDFLLGLLDGKPVAMGGWHFLEGSPGPGRRPAELRRMFVAPAARGRGLGRRMLTALEDSAASAGADWVVLQTGVPQVEAIALYRSAGYREVPPFGYFAGTDLSVHLGRPLRAP